MEIYNARNIDRNSRFLVAMGVGFVSAVALGIIFGRVKSILSFEMEVFYILIGMIIGSIVKYFGRGVTIKFSVLGAVLTFIAIFIGDVVGIYGVNSFVAAVFNPSIWFYLLRSVILGRLTSLWGILAIAFRIIGIYAAYQNSRII